MNEESHTNYQRIALAIQYLKEHFKQQPSLEEIANEVNLSPYHFQRMFTNWSGVSPKKFIQFLSMEYAKQLLRDEQSSLAKTAHETGFSGASRLHDLFVNIEAMTPGEYKQCGQGLKINYSFANSLFGNIIIASTAKGICHLSFIDDEHLALKQLKNKYSKATYQHTQDQHQQVTLSYLQVSGHHTKQLKKIKFHLTGTPFQLKVWQALLTIPQGNLTTYGSIANTIGNPNATRAVGTAIGKNPIAFLIPCHRVIRANAEIGEYMWGSSRKHTIIAWEAAQSTL